MKLNHQLKTCLINYLSTQKFRSWEFKDIFGGFVREYPEFDSTSGYQRIYRIVKLLVDNGFIKVQQTHHYHKYTSAYQSDDLLYFIKNGMMNEEYLKQQLKNDFTNLSNEIEQIRLEIKYYDKYLNQYPKLKIKIQNFRNIKFKQMKSIESEMYVINNLISQI